VSRAAAAGKTRRRAALHPAAKVRPVTVVLVLVLLAAALLPPALAACGGSADPFAGLYWEPATGRRIEIRHTGDAYALYYGRDLRPFPATLKGDRLVISDPMGGKTVVRRGGEEGTLELVTGGKTTQLRRLRQRR
jgi:hypothetical protein